MRVIYERCCGLDIHKKTVVACLLTPGADGQPRKELRTFGTMTDELLALADWLRASAVTHVAMESTGVYWKPIWNLLEGEFALLLANAQHVKRVPGRKTDVKDAEWLADLLRHGLLQGSFVPDRPQRELRELTRYRTSLVQERAAEVNRLQKTLEGANIKLGDVASAVMGVSARQMLAALAGGEDDPAVLAQLALGQLRHKLPALERALAGRVGPHQRFLLAQPTGPYRLPGRGDCDGQRRDRGAAAPFRRRPGAAGDDPGGGTPHRRGAAGRSRRRAWRGSRRRPTWPRGRGCVPATTRAPASGQRQDAQGQPLAAGGPGRGRPRRRPQQGHLPGGAVPTAGRPAGQETGRGRRRPHHPGHRLPPADRGTPTTIWARLLRRARPAGRRRSAASPRLAALGYTVSTRAHRCLTRCRAIFHSATKSTQYHQRPCASTGS